MTACVEVGNLGKRFLIRHEARAPYQTLRESLSLGARNLGVRLRGIAAGSGERAREEFWALRDVDLAIHPGERLGIIGRNGAGKSTLLKILGRVIEPTTGRAVIRGRMASLLEVGTGFHPELTGRENIFLNGAVLGMRKTEIERKFDEIVAFAEIERFLDTPVKWYSSGMYVRLAFAIAAHLDSDILVVDEVLAVGDIQFQKKCLQKMDNVANDGRTVLLVSHNMATILGLSTRCLLLAGGRVCALGNPEEVIQTYQKTFHADSLGRVDLGGVERYGTGVARFASVAIKAMDGAGAPKPYASTGCDLEVTVDIEAREGPINYTTVAITIYDEIGTRLIDANTLIKGQFFSSPKGGRGGVVFLLRNVRLKPDLYVVGLWLGIQNSADIDGVRYATSFRVEANRDDVLYAAPFPGPYACEFDSRVKQLSID